MSIALDSGREYVIYECKVTYFVIIYLEWEKKNILRTHIIGCADQLQHYRNVVCEGGFPVSIFISKWNRWSKNAFAFSFVEQITLGHF